MGRDDRRKDVDYILDEIVGGNGWWQWRMLLITYPLFCISGYPIFLSVFAAYSPPHRCYVNGCDSQSSLISESFLEYSVPKEHASLNFLKEADDFDPCHTYVRISDNLDSCTANDFNSSLTQTCDSYVWDRSQMSETLTTRLNLVCGNDNKRRLFSTVLMLGLMIGSLIGGRITDRLGRKKAMMVSALTIIPNVFLGGLVANFYFYLATRLITCSALPIMWIAGHTYTLEFFSPSCRRLLMAVKDIPIAAYVMILVVHLTRHWTYMHISFAGLSLIGLPVLFFIPESPRWLAGNNRREEAEEILLDIASTNGRTVDTNQRKEILFILEQVEIETESSLSPLDMFRSTYTWKSLNLILAWITVCVGFYALALNSVALSGDIVLNNLYGVFADTPSALIIYFTIDSLGRRYTLAVCQGILGISCLALAFIPKGEEGWVLITYLFGKTFAAIGFMMVYLVTAELFPTNLRAQALGVCSMVARIFGLSASFVPKLTIYWKPLPMLVLGVPTLLSAFLALFLTETRGKDLPQTMKEGEHLDDIQEDNEETNNNCENGEILKN